MPQENSKDVVELCENKRDEQEMRRKIKQSCKELGADVKIKKAILKNGEFIFKAELNGKTTINQLKRLEQDVRIRARLQKLHIYEKGKHIYIIASKNAEKNNVNLLPFLRSNEYIEAVKNLNIAHAIGLDEMGNSIISDLTLYPHTLISGTTGSGKSMAVLILLISILMRYSPEEINLIVCDQANDLLIFKDFPHLSCPVITDFNQFYHMLQALMLEMERRIKLKGSDKYDHLPYILLVVDEFASFISGSEQEKKVARTIMEAILRRGRHARIHVVIVAFNPTKKILKLDIADLPTKFLFRVASFYSSVSVLGEGGAEKLNGNGEMLFQSSQGGELKKLQGFYISPEELEASLEIVKSYWQNNEYDNSVIFHIKDEDEFPDIPQLLPVHSSAHANDRKLFAQMMVWAMQQSLVSCNQLRQNFNIGWDKAKNLMIKLEEFGVISELESKLPRKVLLNSLSEIPKETMEFLNDNGYSEEAVSNILQIKVQGEQENKI